MNALNNSAFPYCGGKWFPENGPFPLWLEERRKEISKSLVIEEEILSSTYSGGIELLVRGKKRGNSNA